MIKKKKNKWRFSLFQRERIYTHPILKHFARWLAAHHLWEFSEKAIERAVFMGLIMAFVPLPIQVPLAAIFSVIIRANVAIAIAMVWITNPITIPPIFYFCYRVGLWLLDKPNHIDEVHFTFQSIASTIGHIGYPLIAGCAFMALISASLGWIIVKLGFYFCNVRKKRKNKRQPK